MICIKSIQGKDVFCDCDVIVSFISIEESKAVYRGAYEVGSKLNLNKDNILAKVPLNYATCHKYNSNFMTRKNRLPSRHPI